VTLPPMPIGIDGGMRLGDVKCPLTELCRQEHRCSGRSSTGIFERKVRGKDLGQNASADSPQRKNTM
jgi:hypothetical protein